MAARVAFVTIADTVKIVTVGPMMSRPEQQSAETYAPNRHQMRTAVKGGDRYRYYKRRGRPRYLFTALSALAVVVLIATGFFWACLIIAEFFGLE